MCLTWPELLAAQTEGAAPTETAEPVAEEKTAEAVEEAATDSDPQAADSTAAEQESGQEANQSAEESSSETAEANTEQSKTDEPAAEQSNTENQSSQDQTAPETTKPEPQAEVPEEVEEPGVEETAEEDDPSVEVEPEKEKPAKGEKKESSKKKLIIGATAVLMEKQSEILFSARVDSGAKSCSLHVEQIKIDNEEETWADNIGKVIHFQITNGKGKKHWLKSKIANYVIIKTSNSRERRYKVPITFQWKDMEKRVLVTLNNRKSMEFPLLIGRNFLRGDFLVDVEVDSND